MTQRKEVRFKFSTTDAPLMFGGNRLRYEPIVFNVGGGTTPQFQYVVPESGIYLMGYSYNKVGSPHTAQTQFNLLRSGTTSIINRYRLNSTIADTTCHNYFMYEFEVDDVLSITNTTGQTKINISSYTGDDTLNSWWGIKLGY